MSDELRKKLAGLPPRPATTDSTSYRMNLGVSRRKKDYSPVEWDQHWSGEGWVENGDDVHHYYQMGDPEADCVLFLLHGGGFSGLSFSLFAKDITQMVKCRVVAPDIRGHGKTKCENENDLSIESLSADLKLVFEETVGARTAVIVGHSMGGAIAVHLSETVPNAGLVVIDVVEGTAIEALPAMEALLRGRPSHFRSIPGAVEWAVRTSYIKNLESARVSMPEQVVRCQPDNEQDLSCKWRIDLSASASYWRGWFTGLSELFLASRPAKMLLLAGMDRLDTPLTVGQMQGKFQLTCMPQAGHAIHEDQPTKVAQHIAAFVVRHRLAKKADGYVPQQMVPGLGGLGRMF